jgi:hypothetical protein
VAVRNEARADYQTGHVSSIAEADRVTVSDLEGAELSHPGSPAIHSTPGKKHSNFLLPILDEAERRHHFFCESRDSKAAVDCFRRFPALPCARTLPFPPSSAGIRLPFRGSARFGSTLVAPCNPPSAPVP